eukprot:5539878-Amphidinium_carterae.1
MGDPARGDTLVSPQPLKTWSTGHYPDLHCSGLASGLHPVNTSSDGGATSIATECRMTCGCMDHSKIPMM